LQNPGDGGGISLEELVHTLLPAILADALSHVSLGVHEAYGHEWYSQVAAFLEVIAG